MHQHQSHCTTQTKSESPSNALPYIKLTVLCASMFLDMSISTFSLPFIPAWLARNGRSNLAIGILGSMTNLTAWIGFTWALLSNSPQRAAKDNGNNGNAKEDGSAKEEEDAAVAASLRKRWIKLGIASLAVTASCIGEALLPGYNTYMITKGIQGIGSAIVWTYCLSLSSSLPRVMGMDAMALVIAGSTVGEVSGPWMGTLMYEWTASIPKPFWLLVVLSSVLTVVTFIIAGMEERAAARAEVAAKEAKLAAINNARGTIGIKVDTNSANANNNCPRRFSSVMSNIAEESTNTGLDSARHSRAVSNASTTTGDTRSGSPSVAESMDNMSTIDSDDDTNEVDDFDMNPPKPVASPTDVVLHTDDVASNLPPVDNKITETIKEESSEGDGDNDTIVATVVIGNHRWSPLVFLLKDRAFMRLAFILCITSLPRGALDLLLPLYLDAVFESTALTIGIVFGCGAVFFVLGSLVAGKFTPRTDRPMAYVSLAMIGMAGFATMVLYMPNIYILTACFCAFAILAVFINVVTCNQLEELAADLRQYDATIGDRVMALACLFWSAGLAISYIIAGLPEHAHDQQTLVAGMAAAAVLYTLVIIIPTYGVPCITRKGDDDDEVVAEKPAITVVPPQPVAVAAPLELVVVREKDIADPSSVAATAAMEVLTLPPSVIPLPPITITKPSHITAAPASTSSAVVPASPRVAVNVTPRLSGRTTPGVTVTITPTVANGGISGVITTTPRHRTPASTPRSLAMGVNTAAPLPPMSRGAIVSPVPIALQWRTTSPAPSASVTASSSPLRVPASPSLVPTMALPPLHISTSAPNSRRGSFAEPSPAAAAATATVAAAPAVATIRTPSSNQPQRRVSLNADQLHNIIAAHQRNVTAHINVTRIDTTAAAPRATAMPRYPAHLDVIPSMIMIHH